MMAAGAPLLGNPGRIAQAIAIMTRESPSQSEQQWFERLKRLTWATLILSIGWVAMVLLVPAAQFFILVPATLCYLLFWPVLWKNLPLLRKLVSAYRRELQWRLRRPLNRIAARQPRAAIRKARNITLFFVGLLAILWGLFGITAWLNPRNNLVGRVSALSYLAFGVTCVLIYPVDRARRRLDVIGSLKSAVETAQRKDGVIDDIYYDLLVCLERRHIIQEREHMPRVERRVSPVVRISDAFNAASANVAPGRIAPVYRAVRELAADPSMLEPRGVKRVEGTGWAIHYSWDKDANEITVLDVMEEGAADG